MGVAVGTMSSSSSSHMDEGSESENEYDYDDLDEEEDIDDEDAAAEEEDDDGDDEEDEPDLEAGGGNRFFDFGSTIHGVVHELRRLNRSRDGSGGEAYDGILGALNQTAANLGFPQVVLPSQHAHGLRDGVLNGFNAERGELGGGSRQRLQYGQLPRARRIHPMLRRREPTRGTARRQRTPLRGDNVQRQESEPSLQAFAADTANALHNLLRSLPRGQGTGRVDADGAPTGRSRDRDASNMNEAIAVADATASSLGTGGHLGTAAARPHSDGDVNHGNAPAGEVFSGPRDFSRMYTADDDAGPPSVFDPTISVTSPRYANENVREHWIEGPSLSGTGEGTFLSRVLDDAPASSSAFGQSYGANAADPAVGREASRRASAPESRGETEEKHNGKELLNNELITRIQAMLVGLSPAHERLEKRKEQFDVARRAEAERKAEAEKVAREEAAAEVARKHAVAEKAVAEAQVASAAAATAEAAAAAANAAAVVAEEASATAAEVSTTAATGLINATAVGTDAAPASDVAFQDAAAQEGDAALNTTNESVVAPDAVRASEETGVSAADGRPAQSMTQLVEERAASVGVSLHAPANEDPDVVAAAVASTSIDPTFLAALPEEMRTEVLAQHFEEVTTAREAEMADLASTTIFAQEFLIALPPTLRADVLEQEATYRSRNEAGSGSLAAAAEPGTASGAGDAGTGEADASGGGAADTDMATFLATLAPELRQEILLTSGESFVAQLPPHMAAEAQSLRDRENARRVSAFGAGAHARLLMQRSRDERGSGSHHVARHGDIRVDNGIGRYRDGARGDLKETIWEYRKESGRWIRTRSSDSEDAPFCSEKSLQPLLGLLKLRSSQYGKSLLHQVLAVLCKRAKTRRQVLSLLFMTLPIPIDDGTNVGTYFDSPPSVAVGGVATESVIVRRVLEILSNLCKQERSVAEDVIAVPSDDASAVGLPMFIRGGLNNKHSPAAALASLLDTSLFKRSSVHQSNLIALLSYAFNALPPATATIKEDVAKVDAAASEDATGNASGTGAEDAHSLNEIEAQTTMEIIERDDDNEQKKHGSGDEQSKKVTVPAEFRIPFLRIQEVHALTNVLLQEGSNEKGYDRITAVLSRASLLDANKESALGVLSAAASKLGDAVASAFETFVSGLPGGAACERRASLVQEFSMAASTDELKFLRVMKAIAAVLNPVMADVTGQKQDSGFAAHDVAKGQIGVHLDGLANLWKSLDKVLGIVRDEDIRMARLSDRGPKHGSAAETSSENAQATTRVPDNLYNEDDEEGDVAAMSYGRSSNGGGRNGSSKTHSLSPILARLSPIIEAFFVCHGARAGKTAEVPVVTSGMANSPRSPSPQSSGNVGRELSVPGDDELGVFVKRNRSAVNAILRVNPLLLDGSFRSALRHAHAIDFDNKKSYFRNLIRKRGADSSVGTLRITVRRDRVFDDSYHKLRSHSAAEMRGRLHVQFTGEEGIDAGGVTREWYVVLARQIFDPNYALFCRSAAKAATYQPNKSSFINQEHLDNFRFVGRVFGKAIYDGQLLDAYFTRAFYKHILGIKPTYHDIEAEDPSYYQSLCWILANDITNIIEETFSSEYEEFGQQRVVDLKPNGRNIRVTEANKEEYVKLITDVKLTKAIEQQIAAFKQGFHELIPLEDCRIFNEVELELLTSGLPDIDVADLKANVEYSGYTAGSPQISWFWNAVSKMGQEDLARLVMFVTGTSKVPLEGFSALQGMNGPQKFSIHRAACTVKTRLPSAHTCFNQLDLPEYDDADTLSERLLVAIRECSVGFGFG